MTCFEKFLAFNGLKQKTVAEYLGVNQSRISHYSTSDVVPADKLLRISENPYGWDISMLKDIMPDDEEQSHNIEQGDNKHEIKSEASILETVILDYQARLTAKDDDIKQLISAVIAQNDRLNNTLEKLLTMNIHN